MSNQVGEIKKYRKCPHCKSRTGFTVRINLKGYQEERRDFSGKLVVILDRRGADEIENYVECLNCKKPIPTENVKIID